MPLIIIGGVVLLSYLFRGRDNKEKKK